MIIPILLQYDTQTGRFVVISECDRLDISHSGSSYLRVSGSGLYGTIATHYDWDNIDFKVVEKMRKDGWNTFVLSIRQELEMENYWGA